MAATSSKNTASLANITIDNSTITASLDPSNPLLFQTGTTLTNNALMLGATQSVPKLPDASTENSSLPKAKEVWRWVKKLV